MKQIVTILLMFLNEEVAFWAPTDGQQNTCMVGECHGELDVTQSQESPRRVPSVVGLAGIDLVHLPISKGHRLPAWPSGSCSHSPQPWPCPNHSIPDGPSASLLPPLGHLQPHPKPLIRGGPNGSISLLCPPPDSQAQEMFMHTQPHPLVHTPCHTVLGPLSPAAATV